MSTTLCADESCDLCGRIDTVSYRCLRCRAVLAAGGHWEWSWQGHSHWHHMDPDARLKLLTHVERHGPGACLVPA